MQADAVFGIPANAVADSIMAAPLYAILGPVFAAGLVYDCLVSVCCLLACYEQGGDCYIKSTTSIMDDGVCLGARNMLRILPFAR